MAIFRAHIFASTVARGCYEIILDEDQLASWNAEVSEKLQRDGYMQNGMPIDFEIPSLQGFERALYEQERGFVRENLDLCEVGFFNIRAGTDVGRLLTERNSAVNQ